MEYLHENILQSQKMKSDVQMLLLDVFHMPIETRIILIMLLYGFIVLICLC